MVIFPHILFETKKHICYIEIMQQSYDVIQQDTTISFQINPYSDLALLVR